MILQTVYAELYPSITTEDTADNHQTEVLDLSKWASKRISESY